ncbi:MAG: hypothetical protein ACE5GE_03920 [Phycisphaerae bacterium]
MHDDKIENRKSKTESRKSNTESCSSHSPPPGNGVYEYLRAAHAPLDECLDSFWTFGLTEDALPEIAAPSGEAYDILKRLGPSPFEPGSFPLIGFLASAYDRVSRFADERHQG